MDIFICHKCGERKKLLDIAALNDKQDKVIFFDGLIYLHVLFFKLANGLTSDFFWLGANDLAQVFKFVWQTSGTVMNYTNWYGGNTFHNEQQN